MICSLNLRRERPANLPADLLSYTRRSLTHPFTGATHSLAEFLSAFDWFAMRDVSAEAFTAATRALAGVLVGMADTAMAATLVTSATAVSLRNIQLTLLVLVLGLGLILLILEGARVAVRK